MSIRRFWAGTGTAVALAFGLPLTAQAAASPPLPLKSYAVQVNAPTSPATACDDNQINCGWIEVTATFGGLNAHPRPAGPGGGPEGGLSGTLQVERSYGCQSGGRRLAGYDRTVTESAFVNSRHGTGFSVPRGGDTLTTTSYVFLDDKQPHNCPAGTTPMTYRIITRYLQLDLDFYVDGIPDGSYIVANRTSWSGAVPTPTAG